MSLSACDIGNPAYQEAGPAPERGQGIVKVQVWFGAGERSQFHDIDYQWEQTPEGVSVDANRPDFTEYILGPDDIQEDITLAIEEELGQRVRYFNWLQQ